MANKGLSALPAVPAGISAPLKQFLDRIRAAVEIQAGQRGDELDSSVTWRDLIGQGVVEYRMPRGGLGAGVRPVDVSNFSTPIVPPAPYNVAAFETLEAVFLTWDIPKNTYVSHYEVWRHTADIRDDAILVGVADAKMYYDVTVTENIQYYYWVKAVSYAGVPGPFNAFAGVAANIGLKVDTIKAELTNQINELTIDGDGFITGYRFYNTVNTSAFIVKADLFAVALPGKPSETPFVIGNVGGVTRIVLDAATYIPDASITNAKIANLAVDNAHIANLAVNNAKIADLAVNNAKIADLAVNAAKITDLAVTTLKIGSQAVTIPTAAYTAALSASTEAAELTVQSVTYTATGAPVQISISLSLDCSSSTGNRIEIKIYRGGAEISSGNISVGGRYDSFASSIQDIPPSGTVTYSVTISRLTGSNLIYASNRYLGALELKK